MFRILGRALIAAVLMFIAIGYLRFGSLSSAWHFFRGNSVCVTPQLVNLSDSDLSSKSVDVSCVVKNLGFGDIKLYGTTACCGFELVDGLPATLRPLESQEVKFRVRVRPGIQKVALFTTSVSNPTIMFSVASPE